MHPIFNYTNDEKIRIKKFKEKIASSCKPEDRVTYVYGFYPSGKRDESDYLLYNHFVKAMNGDGKSIDKCIVAENIEIG